MELGDIIDMRCPVSFDWKGQRIELAYRPYSEAIEEEVRGEAKEWTGENMKVLLERVLLDWNITVKGKPAPVNAATLRAIPTGLFMAMFWAVLADVRNPTLPELHNETSAAGSTPAGD